jgi:hypothetical protein
MKCSACSEEIKDGSEFCSNCGQVATSQERGNFISSALGSLKKFASSKLNLALLGLGTIAVVVAAFIVSPKTVEISVEVEAVNGGVFTQDCKITDYAADLISNEFLAKPKNSESSDINGEIAWFADRGKCVGSVKVTVSPFETFDLYAGNTLIGAIKDGDAWSGEIEGFAAVSVTHEIDVTMSLSIIAGSCSGDAESSWSCSGIYGMSTNSDDGTCYGSGGYYDISKGADILITGKSTEKVYEGELATGTDYNLESTSSRRITCEMRAYNPITVDHDEDGYYVDISDRGKVFFTNENLMDRSWVAGITLGQ